MRKHPDLLAAAFLVLFSSLFIFRSLGRTALIDWDESIYAAVARDILRTGDWLSLRWNFDLWFEKPPLYFWLTALTYRVFGVSEFAARFWSAAFGVLGIVVIYFFGKILFDRTAGFASALALLSTVHWVFQSRNGTLDVMAATLITLALLLFWLARSRPRLWPLVGVCLGLVFMTKSVVALIPLVVMVGYAFLEVIYDRSLRRYPPKGILLLTFAFLLLTSPWHLIEFSRHGKSFIDEYFFYHVLSRAGGIEGHSQPFLWYNIVVRHWARHWYTAFSVALCYLLSTAFWAKNLFKKGAFLLTWAGLTFLILSLSRSKIQWYILPFYPVMALINGFAVGRAFGWLRPRLRIIAFTALLASVPCFLFRWQNLWKLPDYNRDMAETARVMPSVSQVDDRLLTYGISPGPPIFYSHRKVVTMGREGVFHTVAGGGRVFLLSSDAVLEDLAAKGLGEDLAVFKKSGGYVLYGRR